MCFVLRFLFLFQYFVVVVLAPKANILLMFVEVVVLFIGVTIFCRVRKSLFFVFAKEIIKFQKVCFFKAYILKVYFCSLIQRQKVKMCILFLGHVLFWQIVSIHVWCFKKRFQQNFPLEITVKIQ